MSTQKGIRSWLPTLLVAIAVYAGVLAATKFGLVTQYWGSIFIVIAITAITALGLNLIYGFSGQFSLGHIGFYAIGAYASALITKDYAASWSGGQVGGLSWMIAGELGLLSILLFSNKTKAGTIYGKVKSKLEEYARPAEATILSIIVQIVVLAVCVAVGVLVAWLSHMGIKFILEAIFLNIPTSVAKPALFIVGLLTGGTLAATFAYIVGLPLLKLSSDYFGIATLGLAIMIYTALNNSDLVIPTMKGARGMVGIPVMTTWTWAFAALVITVIIIRNLVHSNVGRAMLAVREDEIAAKSMGIDVPRAKTMAFSIGAFFAGVAGGLFAHLYGYLTPASFNFVKGFDPLIIIVFGGLGSMTGTLMASALFTILIEGLRVILPQGFEDWRFVIYPILLLAIMLLRQEGLLGTREWGWLKQPAIDFKDVASPVSSARIEREQ